jgi:hypothetical protein
MPTDLSKANRPSLPTLIAWLSTCLLASGIGMTFTEDLRSLWMHWGCLGLAAAAGLEATARIREQRRARKVAKAAQKRCDRELHLVRTETEIVLVVQKIMARVGKSEALPADGRGRRADPRLACDLAVDVILASDLLTGDGDFQPKRLELRITNISSSGFALALPSPLPPQEIVLVFTEDGEETNILGEIVWCDRQTDGAISAGGRFVRVLQPNRSHPADRAVARQLQVQEQS